ncbi:hypothetical protein ABE450_001075 [Clostridium perfringens]|uniref:Uncharacterized protein n=1 Tax=Clostridium perfringens TaxID=1502 RepID=A0AB37C1K7_CLOPF|nr:MULTISPECIES: hypothetical protein [Clostridium]ASY51640.1 hypothetical protein BG908_08200 [Clostridium perfringens]AWS26155.1 hypothetical protein CYK96_11185 [Clostridium perfringens]EJT6498013.1 hypothetical protein [Clostridium perfringens]MBS4958076.1 hypothetical protein [Clostridium sp.]MCX0376127.1 hypothetical protein [Clostridium perfringens]
MDLDWLYYCYTTILGKREEEFWEATPAKVFKQIEVHSDFINRNKRSNNINNSHEIKDEAVVLKVLD